MIKYDTDDTIVLADDVPTVGVPLAATIINDATEQYTSFTRIGVSDIQHVTVHDINTPIAVYEITTVGGLLINAVLAANVKVINTIAREIA